MAGFEKYPFVEVQSDSKVTVGWSDIGRKLKAAISAISGEKKTAVVELYPGSFEDEIVREIVQGVKPDLLILAKSLYLDEKRITEMVFPSVTNDRIFGRMSHLEIEAFFDPERIEAARREISSLKAGIVLIIGTGAAVIPSAFDLLVYADMARWEIQLRMRNHEIGNLGVDNKDVDDWMLIYKQGFFVDWRVCDRLKKRLVSKWDFVLDTNNRFEPKLVEGRAMLKGLKDCLKRPFSVVPYFDPGPWGGQWMKKVCGLDPSVENYAWCFNCVPEENSLLLKFGGTQVETPAINLVFLDPESLLGHSVFERFGDEFPIRFDYLDTMDGGNLSLQVHPLTEYIREKFGMDYTQDESYYLMDAKPGAVVYLGLKDGIQPDKMLEDLEIAEKGGRPFDAERYVQTWPVKKHDHVHIPAGTVHCSGKDSVVLEISATPYIFTFKLWDWGRMGLDGRPRPINIEHGRNVIQWNRTAGWTRRNLVNRTEKIAEGDGWLEERTGLHEAEFIETRRHWFTKKVLHDTNGGVNVLNLVEGEEVVVDSPSGAFRPFTVHYAETFVVPASVGAYSIAPVGRNVGRRCATIKAFVRTDKNLNVQQEHTVKGSHERKR